MDQSSKVAYIQAQAACAMIEAMAMFSENMQRLHRGESISYAEKEFTNLIDGYGISHNAVIGYLR